VIVLQYLFYFLRRRFKSDAENAMRDIAMCKQLAAFQTQMIDGKIPRPKVTEQFRELWIFLSQNFDGWKEALVLVKPETVLRWYRRKFKDHWRQKSQGRSKISREVIEQIKQMHRENPTLSPEKIHERLVNMNIYDVPAPNTIAKYIKRKRKPPTDRQRQSWLTFLRNQAKCIWAIDFATVVTLKFEVLHVLFVISHDRRRIEHFAVTKHPSGNWVAQQMRNATPFGRQPKYLIHDNAPVFACKFFQGFLIRLGIISKRITPHSPWQNGVIERLIGTVRRDLLDHVIPLNEKHLTILLKEYVGYYNNVRTHQALAGGTPIKREPPPSRNMGEGYGFKGKAYSRRALSQLRKTPPRRNRLNTHMPSHYHILTMACFT